MKRSYNQVLPGRAAISRRGLLVRAAGAGAAAGSLWLVACSGGGNKTSESPAAGGTTAIAKSTPAAQEKPGGTLKFVTNYDVDTLDPIRTKSFRTNVIAGYVYSRLLKFKAGKGQVADGSVEGDAAAKWEQPDPQTLIVHLREGMKLDQRPPTSGRALVAEDVVRSWEAYAADSAYRTDLANSASKDAPITSLKATDDKTIEIKTVFPDAMLLPVLAFAFDVWVLPKEAFTGGFDPKTDVRGTGPWTLEKYTPSVGYSFKKNPNYYDAPQYPLADAIELPIITDTAQAEAQFKAKNIWLGSGDPAVPSADILSVYNDLKKDTYIALDPPSVQGPSLSFSWRENNPFRDVRVRQALSMLIDRDTFIEVFTDLKKFQAAGVKMRSYWTAPYGAGYGPFWLDPKDPGFGPSTQYLKRDVAEAKKLLAAAGLANGLETSLTFLAGTEYGRDWGQRAEALMSMLADGGVKAKANPVDYTAVWIPSYLRKQGDFDGMAMYPNGARADPGQWLQVFLSSSGANNQVAKNFPDLDAKIAAQRRELDRNKRIELFHDIQRYCIDNMVIVPQGGWTDSPVLTWKGLHGPDVYSRWPGNTYSEGVELFPYYWIDDSLRG